MMDVVELTKKLVGFESINPPGYETDICQYLNTLLQDIGFTTEVSSFGDNRYNLIAHFGLKQNQLPIAFTGHMDTVPLGTDDWSYDPFAGVIESGRIYGRGTCDMKGGVAAAICAVAALKELVQEGPGVVLILTGGEETGAEGAKHYVQNMPEDFTIGALVVAEPTNLIPLAGHKGAFWLTASCKGKAAHGSMPEQGDNAIYKMATAVKRLQEFEFKVDSHHYLGEPSVNVGMIAGGQNINSVADHSEMTIDIRTLPHQAHDNLLQKLQGHLESDVQLKPLVDLPAVWTDIEDPWLSSLEGLVEKALGKEVSLQSAPYFTDASILTPHFSVPTVILGPGDPKVAHTVNEYCLVTDLYKAVDVYKYILQDWSNRS